VNCAACGAESPADKRFCAECGSPLTAVCPSCGTPSTPGKRFCADCGAPLAGSPNSADVTITPRVDPAAIAERRICSILFCDLVGFTPLSETRDPEDVRELLSRYFDLARTIIGRYGGVIEKFIGDAVMAVWGAPSASEGDAERAVRAAFDVVDAVGALGREIGLDSLAARAGVVTGEVAVTVGAIGQGMVAGDTVNTAARVQAAADPGCVLVDEGTWRVARGSIAFDEAGQYNLKGKADLVPLWRAQRVVSGAAGSQRIDGLEAPLVGRDNDLRLIKDMFHTSADRRSARLVSVVGPAGVGKTRLGWEFYKYIDGLATVAAWHRGRCLSYGDGVAFWALAEMVRQRLVIAEEDSATVAAQKLDDGLNEIIADHGIREHVRPRLARLLGVETDETPLSREELFAGWRTFFEQIAAADPVVMVVEDLHYADSGLLDFLEYLLDWSRDVPIFVLTLARPELEDRRPGWGTGRRNATSLTLEGLDDTAMDAMIDGLVSGMPVAARAAVAEQSQGIPLYAVETVRMLIDRDVVQPVEGVYRLVADIGALSVPGTLQSLLAARLDALDPSARRLVADAAVLGGTFPVEALVAVSGMSAGEVAVQLADLVRREVLMVRADPLSPDRGQYGFVQTLCRQVAYETLSRRERKTRHLAVADHLARSFADEGEEVAEVIAQHLLDALTAVPDDDDVPVIRRRAIDRLAKAADRANRTGAPLVAARVLRNAADLLRPLGTEEADLEAAALLELSGARSLEAGDLLLSENDYEQASRLFTAHNQTRAAARATAGVGSALRRQGRHEDSRNLLQEALKVLQEHPDIDTVVALNALSSLEAFAARTKEAQELCTKAFRLAQELGLPLSTFVRLFINQGIIEDGADHHMQAGAAYREAVRLAEMAGETGQLAIAYVNLSDSLLAQGSWAEAAEIAQMAVTLQRRTGSGMWTVGTGNLMQALVFAGRWQDAVEVGQRGHADGGTEDAYLAWIVHTLAVLQGAELLPEWIASVRAISETESPQDQMMVAITECIDSAARQDHAVALEKGRIAFAEGERMGVASEGVRWCWPVIADAAFALDDLGEVERMLAWCDEQPSGHLNPIVRADRLRVQARLRAARGEDRVQPAFERAIIALRELKAPYHLAVGLCDYATYLVSVGEREAATGPAHEAREIAARLGARPLLARIPVLPAEDSDVPLQGEPLDAISLANAQSDGQEVPASGP
jgi:predicted ATPase/class 3 adenylate cyclase